MGIEMKVEKKAKKKKERGGMKECRRTQIYVCVCANLYS